MDKNTIRKIAASHIATQEGTQFQDLCDRLNLALYPGDGVYEPTRAGGKAGDMKCDGYCPKTRIFFAAHATRRETAADTKAKIQGDLEGCLAKQTNVKVWRYLTNDTLSGEVQAFVDDLRRKYPEVAIEVWDHKVLANRISELDVAKVEVILDMNFGQPPGRNAPVLDMTWIGSSGGGSGHFEVFVIKNIGQTTAMDCRVAIVGDDGYEWSADSVVHGRNLDAGQEIQRVQYPISDEPTFHNVVSNLRVVMEYNDTSGREFVSARGLNQELVQSKAFYSLKRGEFTPPTQLS